MHLTEENHFDIIQILTQEDWKPLTELIPLIENTEEFGEWNAVKVENGVMYLPHMNSNELVNRFQTIVYDMPIIISFDWNSWKEGRKILSDKQFNFDSIGIPTMCKLISAIVRSDRFCEGALVDAFESGQILKILKSIEKQQL